MPLTVRTESETELVDITDRLADTLHSVGDGACLAHVHHTTAALLLQEAEPRLQADLLDGLASVFPTDAGYAHDQLDGNAHAHLRAAVLGPSVTVPVRDGELALGCWGSVQLVEFDGPSERRLSVTTITAG